jgi:DtxR family transcriptional regulator, iron-dependent repressor
VFAGATRGEKLKVPAQTKGAVTAPRHKPSATIEDYLEAVYNMLREGRTVIAARLTEKMGVAAPTVWATLQRMQRDGLVKLNARKEITLSEAGLEAAESIIRRHRLAECLLVDILGLAWHEAHEEAHRIEHAISPRVEARILAVLDNPTTCPHGNPIPGHAQEPPLPTVALHSLSEGDEVTIESISEDAEEDQDLLRYLQKNGLVPGTRLKVVEVAPFNATITVEVDRTRVTLGDPVSAVISVRPPG